MNSEPVLVIAFNRPDHLAVLLRRLAEIKPERMYIAIDGARENRPNELARVKECQALASTIDWTPHVFTNFQSNNLGCGLGVSTAISWFFEHEERGIILEDDIIPHPSFFPYCTELLDRYEDDNRVFAISGCNFVPKSVLTHPEDAYRFTQVPHIWGWATWRRSWEQHRLDISDWRQRLPLRKLWAKSGHRLSGAFYWATTFELLARKEVDTWDGQLVLACMASSQIIANSNVNLIENIGFGEDATHTFEDRHELQPIEAIVLPTHAIDVRIDSRSDAWTRKHHFQATVKGMLAQFYRYLGQRRRRNS